MSRVEELTIRLLDGELTPEEACELQQLIESDAEAASLHLQTVDLEIALRLGRENLSQQEAVMDRIYRLRMKNLRPAVMALLEKHPPQPWERKGFSTFGGNIPGARRKNHLRAAFAFAAFMGALLTWFFFPRNDLTLIARSDSSVEVQRDGKLLAVTGEVKLRRQDVVRVHAGRAQLKYRKELTELNLAPDSELTILEPGGGKQFNLHSGELTAEVSPQPTDKPLVIHTPQGVATVLGTGFSLTARERSTWLTVERGKVKLLQEEAGEVVDVGTGQFAVAAPHSDLVVRSMDERRASIPLSITSEPVYMEGDSKWKIANGVYHQTHLSRLEPESPDLAGTRASPIGSLSYFVQTDAAIQIEADFYPEEVNSETRDPVYDWAFGVRFALGPNLYKVVTHYRNSDSATTLNLFGFLTGELDPEKRRLPFIGGRPEVPAYIGKVARIKVRLERLKSDQVRICASLWDDTEPANWMIDSVAIVRGPVTLVGLETMRCTGQFRNFRVSLNP